MGKIISAVVLVLLAGNAAAEWQVVDSSKQATLYVDVTTIRQNGNTARIWALHDLNAPVAAADSKFSSTTVLKEFNCTDERARALQRNFFEGRMAEKHIYTLKKEVDWEYVQPGTADATIMEYACGKGRRQ